ncbi:MAG TPA: ABC transporter substrate-binding protein [Verrucomicrobiae bacterium]|jgi:NitT/TauT family transport system substrate-binding protein|nr:ABC transporter substrate-binding protein [Verrucomicrobiae bacterium]
MQKLTVGIDVRPLTRRQFLGGAALGAAALVLPWEALAAEPRLEVGTMKIGDLAPFFIAQEKGFFKDAALDVNAVAMVGGAAIAPALASGALNVGWSNVVSIFQGHQEGFDYRFISNCALAKRGTNETFGVGVAADSPIRSAKELGGKTIATNTVGNITQAIGQHWIDHNGGDSSRVKWVEIPFPNMEAAVVQKHIDAFVAVEPWVTVPSEVHKKTRVLGRAAGGIAPRFTIASFFSSDAWIQKNDAAVKAFVAALHRGIDAYNADPEQAKTAVAKNTGLSPDVVKIVPLPAFEKKLPESDLEPIMDLALRYKLIGKKFPPRDVIAKIAMA